MKMHYYIGLFWMVILPATPFFAQEVGSSAFSLQEAVAYALEHNVHIQNAALDVQKSERRVKEILAGGFPQVNGQVRYAHYPALPVNLIPAEFLGGQPGEFQEIQFGTEHNLSASASATQMIVDGAFFVGLQQAKLYVELREKQENLTAQDLKENVTKAYYTALITRENLIVLEQNLSSVQQLLTETQAMYEHGFVEEIEVDRLRLSVNNLETQIKALERQVTLLKNLLKFSMGMDLQQQITLSEEVESLHTDAEELLAVDFQYMERLDFQIIEMQKNLAETQIKNTRSQYFPRANLFANYDENAQRNEFDFFDTKKDWYSTFSWGVSIHIPIWDHFRKSNIIQQQQIEWRQLNNLQEQLAYSLQLEVMQSRTEYMNALEAYENQRENMALAEKIFKTAQIKYNEGLGSSLEVNNAETTLYQTTNTYINTLHQLLIAKTDLMRALGKI